MTPVGARCPLPAAQPPDALPGNQQMLPTPPAARGQPRARNSRGARGLSPRGGSQPRVAGEGSLLRGKEVQTDSKVGEVVTFEPSLRADPEAASRRIKKMRDCSFAFCFIHGAQTARWAGGEVDSVGGRLGGRIQREMERKVSTRGCRIAPFRPVCRGAESTVGQAGVVRLRRSGEETVPGL